MKTLSRIALAALFATALPAWSYADWWDTVNTVTKEMEKSQAQDQKKTEASKSAAAPAKKSQDTGGLTQKELDGGVKDGLNQAVKTAIALLGKKDGFLGDATVKIPMPGKLADAEKILRATGQGALVDQFIESMNRAAEKAVPETAKVFGKAISSMTLEDALGIIKGPEDALTRYFEKTSREALSAKIAPIVAQATSSVKVTTYYKAMMSQAARSLPFLTAVAPDLDSYVTGKAMDGLFVVMAREEKNFRQNPAARATDLLKKVFALIK